MDSTVERGTSAINLENSEVKVKARIIDRFPPSKVQKRWKYTVHQCQRAEELCILQWGRNDH